MAILRKGKEISDRLHEGKTIKQIYHIGKKYLTTWLSFATEAAIKVVFGVEEGKTVITKTNDYLNQVALTDPARALLLTGFINEDPMLVCSLIETSKTRLLLGSPNAYINTGYKPTGKTILEACYAVTTNNYSSLGSRLNYGNEMFVIHNGPDIQFMSGSQTMMTGLKTEVGKFYTFKLDAKGTAYVDEQMWNVDTFYGNDYDIWLFSNNNSGVLHNANGAIYKYATIYEDTQIVANFVPFVRNGQAGLINLMSGIFYPNANNSGTFTITITDKEK